MSDSESLRPQQPSGELHQYKNGSVDQLYQTPGDSLSMGALVRELQLHPQVHDAGSVAVQTESTDGTPGKTYYFDGLYMLEEKGLLTRPEPLDGVPVHDPGFDITVGQTWRTPFGETEYPVSAIAVPYGRGYFPEDVTVQPAGEVSATAKGRELINQYTLVAGQPRVPVPGMQNPANN